MLDPYEIIIIIAFIIAFFRKKNKQEALPYFTFFITFVFLFEIFFEYYYYRINGDNLIVLNYYSRLCMYYYLFVFLQYFKQFMWAKKYNISFVAYVILSQIYFLLDWPDERLDGLTYTVGMIILFPLILKYLYTVVYDSKYSNILYDPYFYLSFGILIYFASAFPIITFINKLVTINPAYDAYVFLLNLGNIFLSLAYLGVALCPMIPKPSTI